MIDKAELRRLAQAASNQGPWEYKDGQLLGPHTEGSRYRYNEGQLDVMSCCNADDDTMSFIAAANPQTVLALLDEIERLERQTKELCLIITGGVPPFESQHLHAEPPASGG